MCLTGRVCGCIIFTLHIKSNISLIFITIDYLVLLLKNDSRSALVNVAYRIIHKNFHFSTLCHLIVSYKSLFISLFHNNSHMKDFRIS